MKRNWPIAISLLLLALLPATAKNNTPATPVDPHTLTKGRNIATPAVEEKRKGAVKEYMLSEARALARRGYSVETARHGEVIVVTMPAHDLFQPNGTELLPGAKKKLEPLADYLRAENRFKMILAMHSDDTGSVGYKDRLTANRVEAVQQFLEEHSNFPNQIIGYAMADEEPLVPNTSRVKRDKNRRLEIYIVPDIELFNKLKK